jgi:DNA replication and repair protein RecF
MRILGARVSHFRNIPDAELAFSNRLTALVGPNGQGKTNLLEALYSVAALRPLRSASARPDLIAHGAAAARVTLRVAVDRTGLIHELTIDLTAHKRGLHRDDKRTDTRGFLGHLVAVAFTPDDLQLTKAGPEGRRRFLDRAIFDMRPRYLETALRYARALKARNRVLVDEGSDELLAAYEDVLASEGAEILVARTQYLREVGPRIERAFESIARPAPKLELRYDSKLLELIDPADLGKTRAAIQERLVGRRRHDRHRRTTSLGPHLDDLALLLDGAPAKHRASQGQHRAMVLAIKLAEIERLHEALGEAPVLLLDDISSELDLHRSRQLFDALARLEGQVVLTTTDERQIPSGLDPVRIYDVARGTFEPRSEPGRSTRA